MPASVQKLASSPIMKPKFLALMTGLSWALIACLPALVYAMFDWDSTTGPKIMLFILLVPSIANIPVPVFGEQWRTASAVLFAISSFVAIGGLLTLFTILIGDGPAGAISIRF